MSATNSDEYKYDGRGTMSATNSDEYKYDGHTNNEEHSDECANEVRSALARSEDNRIV
jgi:hypothetical protein